MVKQKNIKEFDHKANINVQSSIDKLLSTFLEMIVYSDVMSILNVQFLK